MSDTKNDGETPEHQESVRRLKESGLGWFALLGEEHRRTQSSTKETQPPQSWTWKSHDTEVDSETLRRNRAYAIAEEEKRKRGEELLKQNGSYKIGGADHQTTKAPEACQLDVEAPYHESVVTSDTGRTVKNVFHFSKLRRAIHSFGKDFETWTSANPDKLVAMMCAFVATSLVVLFLTAFSNDDSGGSLNSTNSLDGPDGKPIGMSREDWNESRSAFERSGMGRADAKEAARAVGRFQQAEMGRKIREQQQRDK